VQSAIEAGADGLNFFIGTSDVSRHFNHGNELDAIVSKVLPLLEDIRRNYPHLVLRFSGEDAFRTRPEDLFRVYDPIAPFVDRLGMPDTVGVGTPASTAKMYLALRERYPQMELEGHFHDDRGFALNNSLEAVKQGMRYINTTILGIGERSGIASMTALLFNLFIEREFDKLEGYHLRGSYPINVLTADKLKMLVPSKEPVSLTNRTHTAGIHQNAVLNNATTYEAHPLDQFGVSETEILLGPLSGWNIIHYFLKEIRYYQLDESIAKEIAAVFKQRVYEKSPDISPEQVLIEVAEKDFGLVHMDLPQAAPGEHWRRTPIVQRLDSSSKTPARVRPGGLTGIHFSNGTKENS
jgi:homocitrate synthase